jgi:hypothetical protein
MIKLTAKQKHNEMIRKMELKEKPRFRFSTFKPREYQKEDIYKTAKSKALSMSR